jgi:transcriptional regulator with XRE-family HTH domain
MSESWMAYQGASQEARRLYEQERLVAWVTEAISRLMESRKISKAELAELLGTSRANVTQMLSGGRNMTLRTLADVACVLGARVTVELSPRPQDQWKQPPTAKRPPRVAEPSAKGKPA